MTAHPVFGWLFAVNAAAFTLAGVDKTLARLGGPRVPEIVLLALCAVGGWPAGCVAFMLLRHKTAKPGFQVRLIVSGIICAWLFASATALGFI